MSKFLRAPWFRRAALTASTIVFVLLGTAGVANAASGTINTAGAPLNVRSGPGTGYVAWTSVADGAGVNILCQTGGSSVTGTYGTSSIWDMLSNGGFVSDAYVYTGSNGYVTHACTYSSTSSAKPNPRSINGAIDWEFARLGSTSWEGHCLGFQAEAFGWSYAGWNTAEIGGTWMYNHGYLHTTGIPPRGALVWYHNSAGSGHVTVSLGEGKIIGTSVGGKVGVAAYNYMGSYYRGWSIPYFPYGG